MTEVDNTKTYDQNDWKNFSHTEPVVTIVDEDSKGVKSVSELDKVLNPLEDTGDLYDVKEVLKMNKSSEIVKWFNGKHQLLPAQVREHLLICLALSKIEITDNIDYIIEYIRLLTKFILGDFRESKEFDDFFEKLEDDLPSDIE